MFWDNLTETFVEIRYVKTGRYVMRTVDPGDDLEPVYGPWTDLTTVWPGRFERLF